MEIKDRLTDGLLTMYAKGIMATMIKNRVTHINVDGEYFLKEELEEWLKE